jgi:DegV family protein with EDD domain
MTVKILTDSVADLPQPLVRELDIKVVPILIRWGEDTFRDGVDLTAEQFYQRLKHSKVPPATSLPSLKTFADAYDEMAKEANGIAAIVVSSRLSGTYDVALQSVGLMKKKCLVEVIDSRLGAMAEGLVVLQAARAAQAGASLPEVVDIARNTVNTVSLMGTLETLEYLKRGGRIGKAQAFLGSLLKVNPIITLKNGVIEPAGRARMRKGAIERLYEFALSYSKIDEMAVEDAACAEEAEELVGKLSSTLLKDRIFRSTATPTIGAHTGPGLLVLSIQGNPS